MGTLENGEKQFLKHWIFAGNKITNILDGKTTFRLYDTFWISAGINCRTRRRNGFKVDIEGFEQMLQQLRNYPGRELLRVQRRISR